MSSGSLCYFVGGPMDLTKSDIARAEPYMYVLERPALTFSQIGTLTDYDNARNLLETRHKYRRIGPVPISGVSQNILIYAYVGIETKEYK